MRVVDEGMARFTYPDEKLGGITRQLLGLDDVFRPGVEIEAIGAAPYFSRMCAVS
jgi:hypothetical protein